MPKESRSRQAQRGDWDGHDRIREKKAMPKSGSFDNIEELSADLLARQSRADDLQFRRKDVRRRSPVKHEEGRRNAESARHSQRANLLVMWIERFVTIRDRDDEQSISEIALPASHSRWLFGVSFLCLLTSMQCAYYQLWDLLCVPLGVGLNSLNYWRKPDYGWRRYVDVAYVQFSIYFSCYKAIGCAEPYRSIYYTALFVGILLFLNACRLCKRPAEGRWNEFLKNCPAQARCLEWSTLNHFLLHVACNVGNAVLFVGLRLARSSA